METLGVVVVASLVLGALAGPKPVAVAVAAVAVLLVVGSLSVTTRGDRRNEGLPTCPSLWDKGAFGDRPCEESLAGQSLRGAGPALIILIAGMSTGLLRFVAEQGAYPDGDQS